MKVEQAHLYKLFSKYECPKPMATTIASYCVGGSSHGDMDDHDEWCKYIEFCLVYVVEFFFNEIIIDGDQQQVVFVHNGHPRPVTSKTAFKKEKGEMRNMHHKHRIRMYKNITSRP